MGDGSRWQMHQSECLAWLSAAESGSVDAIVTDPPYSSGGFTRGDRMVEASAKYSRAKLKPSDFDGDNRDQRGYLKWLSLVLSECYRLAKPGAAVCCFTDWRQLAVTIDITSNRPEATEQIEHYAARLCDWRRARYEGR